MLEHLEDIFIYMKQFILIFLIFLGYFILHNIHLTVQKMDRELRQEMFNSQKRIRDL